MPWNASILTTTVILVLFCGNRLLCNTRLRITGCAAASIKHVTNRDSTILDSSKSYNSAVFKDLPCLRWSNFYTLDSTLLKQYYDSSPNDCLQIERATTSSASIDNLNFIDFNSGITTSKRQPNLNDDAIGISNILQDVMVQNDITAPAIRTSSTFSEDKMGIISRNTLPISLYNDFYADLLLDANKADVKRASTAPVIGCDCKMKNDLLDLGQQHFPRYLLNAVCQPEQSLNEYPSKCWRGSYCKPLEYKVKVLTFRTLMDPAQKDPALAWLPDDLRQLWKFKTVTVAAGCFCSY